MGRPPVSPAGWPTNPASYCRRKPRWPGFELCFRASPRPLPPPGSGVLIELSAFRAGETDGGGAPGTDKRKNGKKFVAIGCRRKLPGRGGLGRRHHGCPPTSHQTRKQSRARKLLRRQNGGVRHRLGSPPAGFAGWVRMSNAASTLIRQEAVELPGFSLASSRRALL